MANCIFRQQSSNRLNSSLLYEPGQGSSNYIASNFWEVYKSIITSKVFKVWNGSSWITKSIKVRDNSTWTIKPLKIWNGSTWI
jgi:hypothetical protein